MKNLKTPDYLVISLLSCGIVCVIYHFLYNIAEYTALNDFYVGTTIYNNHNKLLDLLMFPLYVLIFFAIYIIFRPINLNFELPNINFQFNILVQRHKFLFLFI